MKKTLLLAITICLATSLATSQEQVFEKDFPVNAGAELSLDSHKGKIRIRTHNEAVIRVKARIYTDEGRNPEMVDLVEIKARGRSDYVSLEVEYDKPAKGLGGLLGGSMTLPLVDWDIAVPHDAELNLQSHKSEFDVETPSGRVEIESHKGHGRISGIVSDFRLESHKGKFEVEVEQLSDLRIDTHKGDIELILHGADDFVIRGDSHKGDLRFSGRDIPVEKEDDELMVNYRTGNGDNRINISTHKGDIHLRFVD